jgi:tetratricopeptide (TPR) repeat protein
MRYESTAQATPTGPVTPQLVVSLAQVSEQQGDIAQARQHYQRALAQWPGQVDLLRAAARMEDRQGQLVVAESLYQQAAAGSPGDAGALNDLGLCLARQGKLDQSVQAFEQAIHIQPDKALYRNNVATVLVEMRQDSRAIGHMAAVHGTAEPQYNMGQLLVARGRASEAEAFFEAALDTNPDMKEASFALTQLSGRTSDGPASQPTPVQSAQAPSVAASNNPAAAPAANSQPPAAPQFGPQFGPQMSYPSEARTPGYGRSSYMPPAYQPPVVPYAGQPYPANPQPSVPWVGQATPRALPPVGAPQTGIRR